MKSALRWLAVLPGAVLGGLAAYHVARLVHYLTIGWAFPDPNSWWRRVSAEFLPHMALGAIAVIVAGKIAPSRNDATAFVVAALLLLTSGGALFAAVVSRNGWAVIGACAMAFGAGAVAWSIHTGEWRTDTQ